MAECGSWSLIGPVLVVAVAAAACGSGQLVATQGPDASIEGGTAANDASNPLPLSLDGSAPTDDCDAGWACRVDTSCTTPTTLSGRVFDPGGTTPLSNVVVFVPQEVDLPAITPGYPACTTLDIGKYVTATVSHYDGTFTLAGVPTGTQVPVVVQAGKWRRSIYVDIGDECADNAVADGMLRLPRSRSEGDMPQMALLTGGEDNLGCFLIRVGIDPSELAAPDAGGRIDVYRGVGGADVTAVTEGDCTGSSCPLWASAESLAAYDAVLLGCEGAANLQTKPSSALLAMHDWLVSGGKLFGVHSQDVWLSNGPADFPSLATWVDGGASGAPGPFLIDTTAATGQLFRSWGEAVGVTDAGGDLPLASGDIATSVAAVESPAVAWIHDESTAAGTYAGNAKALSVTVRPPIEAGEQPACGVAVLTDIHPGGTVPLSPLPGACPTGPLSAEERVLEYLLFFSMEPTPVGCTGCPPPPPPPRDDAGE
jgi:hypothetical protein